MRESIRPSRAALGAVCYALLAVTSAGAAATPQYPSAAAAGHRQTDTHKQAAADSYFIDFRSRPGYLFGHTYIVYGRLDARGRPHHAQYAGIYPLDGQQGLILGSVVPVPASVRAVKDDYAERPSNIYRRRLSAAQYTRLQRLVRRTRASERHWNLLFNNCNDFAIDVAEGLGLSAPPSWLMPATFIDGMRVMNEP